MLWRRVGIGVIGVVIVLLVLVSAAADSLTVASEWANVRGGPGIAHRVLTTVPPGAVFSIVMTREGWHQIVLEDGRQGWISGKIVWVERGHPALAVVPSAPPAAAGQLYRTSWAVVIGINRYQDTRIPPLNYAEADARAIVERLRTLGFPAGQIVLLLGPEATRDTVLRTLEGLKRQTGREDRLVIFASGHGVTARVEDKESGFFLPYDAIIDRFPPRGELYVSRRSDKALGIDTLLTTVSRLQPKHVLLAIDACLSGLSKPRAVLPVQGPQVKARRLATWRREPVVHVLTAGKAGEYGAEHREYGHGTFTYYLLQALAGNADTAGGNADGLLTFTELLAYVKDRVVHDPRADQDPQYSTNGAGQFLLQLPEVADIATLRREVAAERQQLAAERQRLEAALHLQEEEDRRLEEPMQLLEERRHLVAEGEQLAAQRRRLEEVEKRAATQVVVEVFPPKPEAQVAWPTMLRNSIGMEFVRIPAGEFKMGATDGDAFEPARPVHTVRMSRPFYMGKTEVTQGQWEAVMGNNPSHFTGNPDLPVEQVSWEEVQTFIQRLNAREGGGRNHLPTEAEWEYTARAGSATAYSFGNDSRQLGEYGWCAQNSGGRAHAVGQLKPNDWGVYDMHGNVWEWVQDWYGRYAAEPVIDQQGPALGSARVHRGGGWSSEPRYCQLAYRYAWRPGYRYRSLGFRLLRIHP